MPFGDIVKSDWDESSNSATNTCNLGSPPAVGNLLVISAQVTSSTRSVTTPPAGFSLAESYVGGNGIRGWVYWKKSDGSEQQISVGWASIGSTYTTLYAEYEWDGSDPVFDSNEDTTFTGTNTNTINSGAITPTAVNNLLVSVFITEQGTQGAGGESINAPPWTYDITFTDNTTSSANAALASLVDSSGSQEGIQTNTGLSRRAYGVILSFNSAAAVGPTLTNPTDIKTGSTTGDGTVDADTGDGTLYGVVTQSATPPSVAQIQAGQDNLGAPADWSGNQPVVGTGTQNMSATGLALSTAYWFHFQQQDAGTNDSLVVSADGFTTDGGDAGFTEKATYDGSVIPTDSILHYQTGEQDGGDGQAAFSDSTLSMSVNEYVGLIVENRTDGSQGVVISNTATDIVATLAGGTDNDWDNLDEMHVVADIDTGDIISCEDQVTATTSEVPIDWQLERAGVFTPVYTQTIVAQINGPGLYNVTLEVDGVVTLDAAFPTLSNADGSATGSTSLIAQVDTNQSGGTLKYLVNEDEFSSDAAVKAGQSQAVGASGQQNISAAGLNGSTIYYVHFIHEGLEADSFQISTGQIATSAPSVGAPILTDPLATPTGGTTADGSVVTDKDSGTLFYLVSENASESVANVKAGDSAPVGNTGIQYAPKTGLNLGTQYYYHFLHENAEGDSNIAVSAPFTTEFSIAVLSNPLGSAVNTTANGSVDTDVGGGVLYYLLDLNATSTPAAIKAGRSKVVTAVGTQNVSWGGNPPNSGPFFFHFLQVTEGDSNDVDTAGFFTGDLPPYATLMDAILGVTGGPTINDGLASWYGMTASESLNDAEYRWLIEQGGVPGTNQDMWFTLLRAAGYTGTLNDMLFQYWVNGGAFPVAVPDVVGMTQVAATAAITGAGFVLGTVTGTVDPVISQVPAAGVLANPGTDVDITMTS